MAKPPSFDLHMLALGRLCVVWSYLDRLLNDLVQALLGCTAGQAAAICTEAEGMASRCNLMRLLLADFDIDADWKQALVSVLGEIETINKRRNRFIHDRWELTPEGLNQINRAAKVRAPQSRKLKTLTFDTRSVSPPGEVDDVSVQMTILAFRLHGTLKDLSERGPQGKLPKQPLLLVAVQAKAHDPESKAPPTKYRQGKH